MRLALSRNALHVTLATALLASLSCAATAPRPPPPGAPVDFPLPPLEPPPSPAPAVAAAEALAATTALPPAVLAAIDDLVARALAAGKLPGCVVAIGRHDSILFERAYGSRSLQPTVTPMTTDTVFDLASLTKPLATASSIALLADRGQVDLDAPLRKYLPELGDRGVATLRQALTHTGGFVADTPYGDYGAGPDEAVRRIARASLRYVPGADSRYSDVGFILLGEVVRRVSGKDLAAFARDEVFAPLGMNETGYLPPPPLVARAAPTENVEGRWLQGEVHDPRARLLGGVAGHAGVFSTAGDLALFARSMLGGRPSFLSPRALRGLVAPHDVPRGVRALGWDVRSPYSTNRGVRLSPRAFGHGGYTGTSLWIDPGKDLFIVLLSNRVHPDGHGDVNPLAGAIADLVARAVAPDVAATPPPCRAASATGVRADVETGLDVLVAERFAPLAGRRVGLITNASGVSRDGKRDVDLFVSDAATRAEVKLVAIFAPEHGLATDQDAVVASGRDARTGLPVYSLYGDHFTPSDAELAGIDTLVLNLPDVGVRFFTYASTMHRALRAAAAHDLRFVVLDRPDPIDGIHVEGPVLAGPRSFVNHAVLPVRHGMTMGELALLVDAQDHAGAELLVVPLRGWSAEKMWDDLKLPWVAPSPNLRTPGEALLYPGVALLEATNVSVGRGTPSPFELVGAPWMDGGKVAAALATIPGALRGVRVEPATFTPTASKFQGQRCSGIGIAVTDATTFEPVTLGLALAVVLRRLYPSAWDLAGLAPLLSSKDALAAIERGATVDDVVATYRAGLAKFVAQREKYLLYPRLACP